LDGAIISAAPAARTIFGRATISTAPAELSVPLSFATPDDWGGAITSLPPVLSITRWIYFPRISGFIFSIIYDYSMDLSSSALDISSPDALSGWWIHHLEYSMDIILFNIDPMRSHRERWNYSGAPGISSSYCGYSHRERRCAGIITPIGSTGVLEFEKI
jgi:hypothetical protein